MRFEYSVASNSIRIQGILNYLSDGIWNLLSVAFQVNLKESHVMGETIFLRSIFQRKYLKGIHLYG